jgi:hypothetical protein
MNQKYRTICITYSNDNNEDLTLEFKPRLTDVITHRWLEVLEMALQLYPIDDPCRFYDFNDKNVEIQSAVDKVNNDIDIINNHKQLIDRKLNDIADQHTLNYLHSIFEVHHGHLDKQHKSDYYVNSPDNVKQALADLNIDVHRCEFIGRNRNNRPRSVTTWYNLPKTHHYFDTDHSFFTNKYKFGTIYLTYCEIGKTLLDMQRDDELGKNKHATDEAFKPYDFFSADFTTMFFDVSEEDAVNEEKRMWEYYDLHKDYFLSKGYQKYDMRMNIGMLPVADLQTDLSKDEVLELLKNRQYIKKVEVLRLSS